MKPRILKHLVKTITVLLLILLGMSIALRAYPPLSGALVWLRFSGDTQSPQARPASAAAGFFGCNPFAMSRSSSDQSASARHSPSRSGCPDRICASGSAISRRQRLIHEASPVRSRAISANVLPSPSRIPCLPVYSCQRFTITSQYFGSISRSSLAAWDLLGAGGDQEDLSILADGLSTRAVVSEA